MIDIADLHKHIKARGRTTRRDPGTMNKLEKAYRDYLFMQQRAGKVHSYKFESCKFRLADNTWYTPDFLVIMPDGQVELHETKGFWEDDARVKIKVFAEAYPEYVVRAITLNKKTKQWVVETFLEE